MQTQRTPDSRFVDLPGFPFAPHYLDVPDGEGGALRMHYVDEGPRAAAPVVLCHGEPTWSYLYRKMIPGLVAAGHRVLAPDLVGFGRSDKPTRGDDYSVPRHVAWLGAWVDALDVRDATFFGQDWGSLIGLTVVLQREERFRGIVAANAALPDPRNLGRILEARKTSADPEAFARWQAHAAGAERLDVGSLMAEGLPGAGIDFRLALTAGERAAYDAPFPDASYQAGALVFPSLGEPAKLGAEGIALWSEAWNVLDRWEKPFVTAYGKADPVLGWFDAVFQRYVPGAKGQPHRSFPDGQHFIQEQEPDALVEVVDGVASAG